MRIPIAPEGYTIIAYTTVFCMVGFFSGNMIVNSILGLLLLFVLSFFRDPLRNIVREDNVIYSAADGLITEIREETLNGVACYRVVTFLSVFNCHVNRMPYKGTVEKSTHTAGLFLAAFRGDIDKKNERQETILSTDKGVMKVVQITGAIARRILCHVSEGQEVKTGERFGLIRFGSRTDLIFPQTASLAVKKGNMVKGGLTPIARF